MHNQMKNVHVQDRASGKENKLEMESTMILKMRKCIYYLVNLVLPVSFLNCIYYLKCESPLFILYST